MFDAFVYSPHFPSVLLLAASGVCFVLISLILSDAFRENSLLDEYLKRRFTARLRRIFLWTAAGFVVSLALSYALYVFQHPGLGLLFLGGGIILSAYYLKEAGWMFLQDYRRAIGYVSVRSLNGVVRKVERQRDDSTLRITLREAHSTIDSEFEFADYTDLRAQLFIDRPIRLYYRTVSIGTETFNDVQEILFLKEEETG